MKKIKLLSLILALVMVLGLFAGCGSKDPADDTTAGQPDNAGDTTAAPVVEDNYKYGTVHGVEWTWGGTADKADEEDVKRQEERNAEYLADFGNTRVNQEFSYDYTSIGAQFEGGQMPTSFSVAATEPVKLIRNGWGRPIQDQVAAAGIDLSKFNQAILNTYYDEEGNLYGLPNSAYCLALLCNATLFEEAGLVNEDGTPKLPTTWDEVMEYSKTINEKTGKGGFAYTAVDNVGGWFFTNIAWNFGADLVVDNGDGTYTAQVNSPEAVAAMTWMQDMAKSGAMFGDPCVDTRDNMMSHMKTGNVAMVFGASDNPGSLTDNTKDGMDPTKLYLTAIPGGPGGRTNLTGGSGIWFAPNATDEQVMAVLEYMNHYEAYWVDELSEENVKSLKEGWELDLGKNRTILMDFPVYMGGAYEAKAEVMKEFQTNFDYEKQYAQFYADVTAAGALTTEEEGDTQNLYRELTAVLQQVMADPTGSDVQALMDTAQTNVEILLEDFGS